ncbi:hypothetical protein [Flavobacterium sp. LM4]|uniref:hypothetical protein n=1 Tax=Flavobacterium sp. LM4 TaxID=1938609 RepID=UPI000993B774|nr:hypothetical protein [Flavobacterium sp. LM4]
MLSKKGLSDFPAYGMSGVEALTPIVILIDFRTIITAAVYAFNCLMIILWLTVLKYSLWKTGRWAIEVLGLYLFELEYVFFYGSRQNCRFKKQ